MAPGELLAPPAPLAPLCHCAMSIRLPEIDYHLPASLHPMLLLVCTGRLAVRRGERWQPMARLSLCGPTRFPQTARAAAGTWLLTVSIRPGQLQRLCDANALALRDQCIALDEAVQPTDRGALAAAQAGIAHAIDARQAADALWRLLAALHAARAHRARDLVLPLAWAGEPAGQIAARLGLGLRQFERVFLASHGQSWRGFRQQLRFSQALAHLLGPADAAPWAERALDWGYCDQSHLQRDFIRFAGQSPARLASGVAGGDAALWPLLAARGRTTPLFGPSGH